MANTIVNFGKMMVRFYSTAKALPQTAKSPAKDGKFGKKGRQGMIEQLKSLQKRSGLTAAQWSQKSGVPVDTINKILSGTTKSPGFQTICDLVLAAGGSVNELVDMKETVLKTTVPEREKEMDATMLRAVKETYDSKIADLKESHALQVSDLKEYHKSHLDTLGRQIADLKYSRRVVAIAFAFLLAFVLCIIVFDVTNGNVGYVLY